MGVVLHLGAPGATERFYLTLKVIGFQFRPISNLITQRSRMSEELKVYVVLEEDRGLGTIVVGVFASKEDAQELAASSGHYYISEEEVIGIPEVSEWLKLFGRYKIEKADGGPIDPEAKYFVLRYDHKSKDPEARAALFKYAAMKGFTKLHEELRQEDIKQSYSAEEE